MWSGLYSPLDQLLGGQWWWWPPHPSNCSASSTCFSISSALGGASLNRDGDELERGLLPFSASIILTTLGHNTIFSPPFSSFLSVTFVLTMLEFRWRGLGNVQVVRPQSCKSCMVAILNFWLAWHHFAKFYQSTPCVWRREKKISWWGVQKIWNNSGKGGWGI